MNLVALSKAISHALRHEPEQYGLCLDAGGWVALDALLAALGDKSARWANLTVSDIERVMADSEKKRFEIQGDRIRATYGHSHADRIERSAVEPPALLYHGTDSAAAAIILSDGLRPMGRQNVHLSSDIETAKVVGRRKSAAPVILQVDAAGAHAAGLRFYYGNDTTWLADEVPPTFLSRMAAEVI